MQHVYVVKTRKTYNYYYKYDYRVDNDDLENKSDKCVVGGA
jgi:hypothetical protein